MGREGESGEGSEGGWGWVPGVWSPGVCRVSVGLVSCSLVLLYLPSSFLLQVAKDVTLINHVPQLKRGLETLVFKVKVSKVLHMVTCCGQTGTFPPPPRPALPPPPPLPVPVLSPGSAD